MRENGWSKKKMAKKGRGVKAQKLPYILFFGVLFLLKLSFFSALVLGLWVLKKNPSNLSSKQFQCYCCFSNRELKEQMPTELINSYVFICGCGLCVCWCF